MTQDNDAGVRKRSFNDTHPECPEGYQFAGNMNDTEYSHYDNPTKRRGEQAYMADGTPHGPTTLLQDKRRPVFIAKPAISAAYEDDKAKENARRQERLERHSGERYQARVTSGGSHASPFRSGGVL